MKDAIDDYNRRGNAVGLLQEYFQKRGDPLPDYRKTSRSGPDHKPFSIVRMCIANGRSFEGSGRSLPDARKDAAQKALDDWKMMLCRNAVNR